MIGTAFSTFERPVLPAVLALLILGFGCGNKSEPKAAAAPAAMPVKMQPTAVQQVGNYTEFIATLKSRNASVLQPEVEGQITRIFVKSGDRREPPWDFDFIDC